MSDLKRHIKVTIALGVLSLIGVVASHLALTDIYHGESDVSTEWLIVRASAFVILVFIAAVFLTLRRVLSRI